MCTKKCNDMETNVAQNVKDTKETKECNIVVTQKANQVGGAGSRAGSQQGCSLWSTLATDSITVDIVK